MRQRYVDNAQVHFEHIKLKRCSIHDEHSIVEEYYDKMLVGKLHFHKPAQLDVKLCTSFDGERNYVIYALPHIISDAVSMNVLGATILKAYQKLMASEQLPGPPRYNFYFDYVRDTNNDSDRDAAENAKFWHDYVSAPQKIHYPFVKLDYSRQYLSVDNLIAITLSHDKVLKLQKACQLNDINMGKAMIALSGLMVAYYTKADKSYIFNIGLGDRTNELKDVIGCLWETELWKVPINQDSNVKEFIRDYLKEVSKIGVHQKCPYSTKWWAVERHYAQFSDKNVFLSWVIKLIKLLGAGFVNKDFSEEIAKCLYFNASEALSNSINKIKAKIFRKSSVNGVKLNFYVNYIPYVEASDLKLPTVEIIVDDSLIKMPLVYKGFVELNIFGRKNGDLEFALNSIMSKETKLRFLNNLFIVIEYFSNDQKSTIRDVFSRLKPL